MTRILRKAYIALLASALSALSQDAVKPPRTPELVFADLEARFTKAVAVIFAEVEVRQGGWSVKVLEVWKGDGLASGDLISIPDEIFVHQALSPLPLAGDRNPPPRREETANALIFFNLKPAISSRSMKYFTGDRLREMPEVTKERLKEEILRRKQKPNKAPEPTP